MKTPGTGSFDVIVVGLGTMGAAAARELTRRGASVLGLEQYDLPHSLGAHHGGSRFIRLAYFEDPCYVPLLRRAFSGWEDLEAESGRRLLHRTGGLYMGPPDHPIVKGSLEASRTHGLPHRLLDHRALLSEFPVFRVPEDFVGFHEEAAGVLLPEQAVSDLLQGAMRRGAVLRGRDPVLDWRACGGGVEVRTPSGTWLGRKLILAGGAWSEALLRDLRVPLQVTRQVMAWFWPREPERLRLGDTPSWFIATPGEVGHYGFPMLSDPPGFKIASHAPGETTHPDRTRREADPSEAQPLAAFLERHIPAAAGPLLSLRTCLYTNTPDGHFIIDRHPDHPDVAVAAGFSGHGFKFAPAIGEVLADLAVQGGTDLPIDAFSIKRF